MAPAETHPAMLDDESLLRECSRRTTRRTGPGGQHRNKTETAVVLTHLPTGLCGEGSESRSQAQNLKAAIFRLRQALAEQIRLPVAVDAPPSDLWRSLVRGRKLSISGENNNFPSLLAEALDRVAAHEFDVATAAAALEVSTTQLVRFLQQSPLAWRRINAERTARSLRPLR